jgi:acetyl-CoA C-acetyltransferase
MSRSYVLAGARTPMGKLAGALAGYRAHELGGIAIAGALQRAGLQPGSVGRVIMGQVLQAGAGQNPARQAAVAAGIPLTVPAVTVNKVCLSSLYAVHLADLAVRSGEAQVVVAGGMESMTNAPYLLAKARQGYRYGKADLLDAIEVDGLLCAFDELLMGSATDNHAAQAGISRDRQDELAALSHQRAAAALREGKLAEEIVTVPGREPVEADEGIRAKTTVEILAKLKPAFSPAGTITAGNASQISDGAAALVVASPAVAERLGTEPLAELVGYGEVAGPDLSLLTKPSQAVLAALERAGLRLADVDLFEVNEAFAAVVAASAKDLGVPDEVVNPNGGAVALGHPIGMSGARLVLTLASELRRRGGGLGAAALCGGGGQGDAALVRVPA